jgi:iron complex transport system substrate-binding protein
MTLILALALLLPIPPSQRIVSTAPSITEIVFALGAGDRLVGVTTYCLYPEAAKTKPKIGGFSSPSLELIIAQRPDVVFLLKDRTALATQLKPAGIVTVELDNENLHDIYDSITTVAATLDLEQRGKDLIQTIERDIRPRAGLSQPTTRRRAVIIVGRTPGTITNLIVAGRNSYLHELLGLAGGVNVFGDTNAPYPSISFEALVSRDPDVIIDMGHSEMVTEKQKQAVVRVWQQWPLFRAVRNQSVFPISADYFVTPGPRIGEAVQALRKILSGGAF